MYKFVVDIVSMEFMPIFQHTDGTVQLMNGNKIHADELRSDRVLILTYMPTKSSAMNWRKGIMSHIMHYMPLTKLIDNIPLQALPV